MTNKPKTKSKNTTKNNETPVDVLGIISLVLTFAGQPLFGFILGLIGVKKARKEGNSPLISQIGWIVGLILTVIVTLVLVLAVAITIANDTPEKKEERRRRNNSQLVESI